jgi:hypothetical protein
MVRVRTKGPGWIIRSELRVKVGRLTMGEGLESECGNFENDSLPNGKPVETMKGRCNVVKAVITRKDDASKGILNSLELVKRFVRETIQKGIAVVEARGDKGVSEHSGRVDVKGWTNLTQLPDVVE